MFRGLILSAVVGVASLEVDFVRAETLTVPSTNPTGVMSSPLQAGVLYEIVVEGTYIGAFAGQEWDAEWGPVDDPGSENVERPCEATQDVVIDDMEYNWMGTTDGAGFLVHTFSPLRIYKVFYVGQGASINLRIVDSDYNDNSGSLTVNIDPACPGTVPTVSEWGLIVTAVLVLAAGTLVFMRRRPVKA